MLRKVFLLFSLAFGLTIAAQGQNATIVPATNNVNEICQQKKSALANKKNDAALVLNDLCQYYLGEAKKDLSGVNLSDAIVFHGPIAGELKGRAAFDKGAYEFLNGVKSMELKELLVDNNKGSALIHYEMLDGKTLSIAEFWTRGKGKKGRLETMDIFFDARRILPPEAK